MPSYRCYFLDSADHVAATELIDCDHPGIEVWDRGRRVHYARKAGVP